VKRIPEEVVRQYLGDDVQLRCSIFGTWHFKQQESGLRGWINEEDFVLRASIDEVEDEFDRRCWKLLEWDQPWRNESWSISGTETCIETSKEFREKYRKIRDQQKAGSRYSPFTVGQIKHYFGPRAKIKKAWGIFSPGAGFYVSLPDGSGAIFGPDCGIIAVFGSSEVYATALRLAHEVRKGPVVVQGSKENILAALAHETPEIGIIPEIYPNRSEYMKIGIACGILGIIGFIIGSMSYNVTAGVVGGFGGAEIVSLIWACAISRGGVESARRKGQTLRSQFPAVHGSTDRRAGIDEARQRGML
jgi:hypothetical protein